MSEKVTPENLKKYATEFCAITLAKAYQQKEVLNGHDLLKLTPVRRINQHLVARLSSHWNSQIQNLTSPYFDFGSDEVKAALEHFSNVVSQHISLRREHLSPWLQDIVEKTLAPLAAAHALSETEKELVSQFSSVHSFPFDFNRQEPGGSPAKTPSFFSLVGEEEPDAAPDRPAAPAESREQQPAATAPPRRTETRPESINSRFSVETQGFPENLNYGSVRLKLESIGQSISLAQRFMFVGQLFKGDFEAFSQSVKILDDSNDWETANAFVTKNLAEKYDWDLKSEAVTELMTLIGRKFR